MSNVASDARLAHVLYVDSMGARGIQFPRDFEEDSKTWRRLASLVESRGFDMRTFMEAQFESIRDVRSLTPARIACQANFNDTAKRYYRKIPRTTESGYADKFRVLHSQLLTYEHRLIPRCYTSRNEILRDINMPFPAWLRVLLADENQPDHTGVFQCYGQLAKDEYAADVGLRIFLVKLEGEYNVARFRRSL